MSSGNAPRKTETKIWRQDILLSGFFSRFKEQKEHLKWLTVYTVLLKNYKYVYYHIFFRKPWIVLRLTLKLTLYLWIVRRLIHVMHIFRLILYPWIVLRLILIQGLILYPWIVLRLILILELILNPWIVLGCILILKLILNL